MAKITLDWTRLGHLFLLVSLTLLIGRVIADRFGFGKLTAYGLSCSLVCQISNVIMKNVNEGLNEDEKDKKSASKAERRKAGGNPKKRKQLQKSA